MTEDKKILQMPHQLILEDRRALTVSGVSDVDSFYGALDINTLTPIEAMNLIYELKQKL